VSLCPTEEQRALREAVARFCRERLAVEALRALEASGGVERGLWKEIAALGVFDLALPTARGGAGLGAAEAVLVFEALGQAAAPGPLLWTHLAAGLVEGAADGSCVVSGIDALGPDAGLGVIEHASRADALLVLRADGVERVKVDALRTEPLPAPLDPLTPAARIPALPRGERIGGPDEARALRDQGALLGAAFLLGMAEAMLELSVAFAKTREQFERPIGSFQALKHTMADMFARQELARGAVYAAAAAEGERARAISSARVVAGHAAQRNARACIQIHGGMGYTWEVPAHYYLKRAWALEGSFGSSEEHAARIAAPLGASAA
jgi:alkylation response protein AidB-like acyl-CoA dehydrogenase